MVVHDEETLQQALTIKMPVRFIDRYSFTVFDNPDQLEHNLRRAVTREEIAIVVPLSEEQYAESFTVEYKKFRERKRREEIEQAQEFLREHPEQKERWRKYFEKTRQL